jgi:hypothetical protein
MWVLRLTRDGARATGFGNNGLVVVPGLSDGDSVAIQEDGKILASGIAYNETTNGYDFDLVRLLPDGDFDSSFGVGGHARHSLKVGSGVREASTSDVTIQPDGRAVAVVTSRGSAPVPQVALRFLSDRDATGERIPPDTAIDSGPEATATTREATFTFSSSEPGTFRCQMDDWGWGACTSPKSYPGMAEGPHTFRVRAVDLEGNTDLTPATHTWTIKLPPPPSANLLANGSFETGLNGWVGWHATLAAAGGAAEGTGAAKVSLGSGYTGGFSIYPSPRPVRTTIAGTTYAGGGAVRSDAAGVKVCLYIREWDGSGVVVAQSASCLTSSTSWQRFPSITYTTLQSGGSLELYAYASGGGTSFDVDALTLTQGTGTPADTAPPDTTIIAGPSGTTGEAGASFSFDATEPSTFECTLDGSAWTSCSSPKQYSGLAPGQHTFRARATDTAGNTDASPATRTWTIQAAPPPPSTNLLVNGGFEDGTSGWTGWHAALSTLTPGAEGAGAAQVTLAAGYTGGFSLYPSPRPVRTTIAGTAYTARGQMRSDTAGKPICLYIREWSAAGAVVAQASSCVTSTTAWQLIPTVRYTTGESGGSLEIYVYGSGLTSFAVDGLVLAPA